MVIFETEIVSKLKEFFEEAYSANRMRVALAG
jgi:secreted Zn-dependent insulinase-like peptidase